MSHQLILAGASLIVEVALSVGVQAWLHLGHREGSAYITWCSQTEYHVLGQTSSPLEDLPSVSNASTQSLVNLQKYRLSCDHNIHSSTSMLIVQSLQQTTLNVDTIPRGNPDVRLS